MIYIYKNDKQSGPYEEHVVLDQLKAGMLSPEDMAIRHGESEWSTLRKMFPDAGAQTMPPPPPPVSAPKIAVPPTASAPVASAPAAPAAEPQYRSTLIPKVFFALCFVAALGIFGFALYYLLTFKPSGDLQADLGRYGYRDLSLYLAIGAFVGGFFILLALVLSFFRKLIRTGGVRIGLRVVFILILLLGLGGVIFGGVMYATWTPSYRSSAPANEMIKKLEEAEEATGPYEIPAVAVPIGLGLFLFGLSGILMTKRPSDY
jgi:hypothetical protein